MQEQRRTARPMNQATWLPMLRDDQDDVQSSQPWHLQHEEPLQSEHQAQKKHLSRWRLCRPDEIEQMGQEPVFQTCAEAIARQQI